MAVLLGQKLVKDTTEYNDYAIGITLPIQISNTAFNQSFQTIDQVKTNIKSLLLTKRRERLMQPQLGSGLQELLFDFNDDNLSDKIEEIIIGTLEQWIPYVTIDTIDVRQSDLLKDTNTVEISLTFKIQGNPTNETVTFTL
jgi:phage baseplate assembly protein W